MSTVDRQGGEDLAGAWDLDPESLIETPDGSHLGQRSCGRITKAGHMTASNFATSTAVSSCEPGAIHTCPGEGRGREKQQRDVGRHDKPLARMPAVGLQPTGLTRGAIEDEHGMGAGTDAVADLDQVLIHRRGVDHWHDDGGAGVARRADGAEQVGVAEA